MKFPLPERCIWIVDAFATVIPAWYSGNSCTNARPCTNGNAYNRTPESAQPFPSNERNDVGSFDVFACLDGHHRAKPAGSERAYAPLISANTERFAQNFAKEARLTMDLVWMMGAGSYWRSNSSPSSRAAATVNRRCREERHTIIAPATTNQNAANNATTTNNRRRGAVLIVVNKEQRERCPRSKAHERGG